MEKLNEHVHEKIEIQKANLNSLKTHYKILLIFLCS